MASLCVCPIFYMCVYACFEGFLYVQLRKYEKGQLVPGLELERGISTEEGKEIENLSKKPVLSVSCSHNCTCGMDGQHITQLGKWAWEVGKKCGGGIWGELGIL